MGFLVPAAAAIGAGALAGTGITATAAATTAAGFAILGVGTLAVAGVATAGVLSTIQSVQQAEQQAELAEFQADMEMRNARMAASRAERLELEADQQRAAILSKSQQTAGTGRAGYAASGVVLGSGVALDYEADVADVLDLDMRSFNYDIKNQQWQLRVQASNHANQAAMHRAQAKGYKSSKTGALIGGILKTGASTIGNAIGLAAGLSSLAAPAASLKNVNVDTLVPPLEKFSPATYKDPVLNLGKSPTLLA